MIEEVQLDHSGALAETLAYLNSAEALKSLVTDPYWPKWDGPWWRMLLLYEMGLSQKIPAAAVEGLVTSMVTHCLTIFPIKAEDIPAGADPYRAFPCHCQLGTAYQVLFSCGVDVDARLPWIRPWFLRYQLPDGGLNCDEAVYTKAAPHSSVVSTLPTLEAVLRCTRRPFTAEEERFLDRGAEYLIARRLWRSVSRSGAVMDEAWAKPCFPRYYHYDLLRGLSFLTQWAEVRGRALPREAVAEAVEIMAKAADARAGLAPGRRAFEGAKTIRREADGTWQRGALAATFPLLEAVSVIGVPSPYLSRGWAEVRERLGPLEDAQ